jgi:hypothetical protein
MAAVAQTPEVTRPARTRWDVAEACLATAAFAVLCVLVLRATLIAAGTGALLWTVLAAEASTRRRTWVGLAGFVP